MDQVIWAHIRYNLYNDTRISDDNAFNIWSSITGSVEKLYNEFSNMDIAGVTFFPAERGRSYDFYASSKNKNSVLYMNLASGKVEMIEGKKD